MDKFSTGFKGYKKSEVNKFVLDVIKQVEEMIEDLKKKDLQIVELEKQVEHFKNMENTFNRAIILAEEASSSIKRGARDEADSILEEAKRNSSKIVNNALKEAEMAQKEALNMRRNIVAFKRRLKHILESQLDLVDDIENLDL